MCVSADFTDEQQFELHDDELDDVEHLGFFDDVDVDDDEESIVEHEKTDDEQDEVGDDDEPTGLMNRSGRFFDASVVAAIDDTVVVVAGAKLKKVGNLAAPGANSSMGALKYVAPPFMGAA